MSNDQETPDGRPVVAPPIRTTYEPNRDRPVMRAIREMMEPLGFTDDSRATVTRLLGRVGELERNKALLEKENRELRSRLEGMPTGMWATAEALRATEARMNAAEKRVAEFETELSKHQQSTFHPDWSLLKATQESLREHMAGWKAAESRALAAEKRVAELEALKSEVCDHHGLVQDVVERLKAAESRADAAEKKRDELNGCVLSMQVGLKNMRRDREKLEGALADMERDRNALESDRSILVRNNEEERERFQKDLAAATELDRAKQEHIEQLGNRIQEVLKVQAALVQGLEKSEGALSDLLAFGLSVGEKIDIRSARDAARAALTLVTPKPEPKDQRSQEEFELKAGA